MQKLVPTPLILPKYASDFHCIGGDCEDTCCAGWRVDLDQESFLHYQATFDAVLRPLVTKHLKRNAQGRTSKRFGHIAMKPTPCQECPFLGEDKLCLIQQRLGESALSNTCASFPRDLRQVPGSGQLVLSLACPEAARLALLQEDAFEFIGGEVPVNPEWFRAKSTPAEVPEALVDEVRLSLFQTLRTFELPVRERLTVLGLVCEGVSNLLAQGRPEGIPDLLAATDQLLEQGHRFAPEGGGVERLDVQARAAGRFLFLKQATTRTPRHEALLSSLIATFALSQEGSTASDQLTAAYELGLGRLRAHPLALQVLDRYLLNEALREVFPWGEKTPLQHFATLLIRFSVLRLMLVGRAAAAEESLQAEGLVETTQIFSRLYSHTADFAKVVQSVLGREVVDRLERLYPLI